MIQDLFFVLWWWVTLFIIGITFFPLTKYLFQDTKNRYYIFSKIIGIGILSYASLLLGTLHILPFHLYSLLILMGVSGIINFIIFKKSSHFFLLKNSGIIVFQELIFFLCIIAWAYIRAHEPSIHGLEKFMDYGFVNSILRTNYFPPKDIWLTPLPINYYFFGHLATAVLTRLSGIPSSVSYNLMIATLFAFTFTGGFSILYSMFSKYGKRISILGGILGGTLISLSGNLHTLYAFFVAYKGENPVPPWLLSFTPNLFPNSYWYPNATRFIPFTIHEFPLYSFVVSDLHGHVADIPFVLTIIALLYSIISSKKLFKSQVVFLSFLLAIMYMTNVWDGIIYLLLTFFVFLTLCLTHIKIEFKKTKHFFPIKKVLGAKLAFENLIIEVGITILLYIVFTIPFSLFFKPFVSGIGVLCVSKIFPNLQKIGPLLFEADHCQQSPAYQLLILYGFFYFFAFVFFVFLFFAKKTHKQLKNRWKYFSYLSFSEDAGRSNLFILILILLSTLLIILPEILYAKDIYPQHYRANTMFKLVYQSFIMLGITSSYIIIFILISTRKKILKIFFTLCSLLLLTLVLIYPYFAIKSYYGDLKTYSGLDGTKYLRSLYPGDLEAIDFLQKNVKGQPVVLEAQGDSYTDFARISANTGLPTILGWTVHEWLWRGTYDIPQPRIEEIRKAYEGNMEDARQIISKYKISYVVVGELERRKYPKLNTNNFNFLGQSVFQSKDGKTIIYKIID
ncbi:MAG: hypothetical protein KBC00_00930 [Candidatus Levybacteria bacterium]|nr:hypothetical protein [Candidatus Levybacteria bacterium]MBP9814753.1 hypothetical protein [Candidatus Levybacteria bacterium]